MEQEHEQGRVAVVQFQVEDLVEQSGTGRSDTGRAGNADDGDKPDQNVAKRKYLLKPGQVALFLDGRLMEEATWWLRASLRTAQGGFS